MRGSFTLLSSGPIGWVAELAEKKSGFENGPLAELAEWPSLGESLLYNKNIFIKKLTNTKIK